MGKMCSVYKCISDFYGTLLKNAKLSRRKAFVVCKHSGKTFAAVCDSFYTKKGHEITEAYVSLPVTVEQFILLLPL